MPITFIFICWSNDLNVLKYPPDFSILTLFPSISVSSYRTAVKCVFFVHVCVLGVKVRLLRESAALLWVRRNQRMNGEEPPSSSSSDITEGGGRSTSGDLHGSQASYPIKPPPAHTHTHTHSHPVLPWQSSSSPLTSCFISFHWSQIRSLWCFLTTR